MINTALIQEHIDSINRRIRYFENEDMQGNAKQYHDLRDQWQAILQAVEQQVKQEPIAYLTMRHDKSRFELAHKDEKATNPEFWTDAFPVFT